MDEDLAAEKLADLQRRAVQHQKRHYARQPKNVSDIVAQLLVRRGYGAVKSDERLRDAWAAAVGDAMARLSQATRITRGRLEVIVSNNLVMQELGFDRQRLLSAMQQSLPTARIEDIKFRVGRLA